MSYVPATGFNPDEYKLFPHVAVLDEFRMTNGEGSLVAVIDSRFIDRLVRHMAEREMTTGDLCPIVIGHTRDDIAEASQPVVVGVVRNWSRGDFFDTGRQAAFADFWIRRINRLVIDGVEVTRTADEIAEQYRRRSAEVWADRYEIDPVSLLGATTPARDLGPLKFSRSGSFTYFSPGDLSVPTPAAPNPMSPPTGASPSASGVDQNLLAALGQLPIFQQIQSTLDKLSTLLTAPPGGADAGAGAAGAPADAEGAAGGGDELSDEELAQLLGEGGDQGGNSDEDEDEDEDEDDEESRRNSPPPVQNMGGPGGMNTHITSPQVKLNRQLKGQVAELQVKLARQEIKGVLTDLRVKHRVDVNPEDEELISDLAAMTPDMRTRQLNRLKLSRPLPSDSSFGLDTAVANSTDGSARRITSVEDRNRVMKLARDKKTTYEAAATELGFTIG